MFDFDNRTNMLLAVGLSMLLTACGGSGSGSETLASGGGTPSPETPAPATPTPNPTTTPAPGTPTPTPQTPGSSNFSLVSSSPESNAVNRSLVTTATLTFNKALVPATVNTNTVYVLDDGNQRVPMSIAYSDGNTSLKISFNNRLMPSEEYTMVVSSGLMAADGESFTAQRRSFKTVANIGSTSQSVIDQCMTEANINMLAAVNIARSESRSCGSDSMAAVPALAWNCLLKNAAVGHTRDMVDNNFFSHTSSDGSELRQRIERTGYQWNSIGENIARGQRSIAEVMTAWIDSPGHCRNIMGTSFTEFGSSEISFTWTQNFGRSRGQR